jgi:two-component system, LytTR family, sensor kinase
MIRILHPPSKKITLAIHVLIWVAFLFVPLLLIETEEGRRRFLIFGGSMGILMAIYFYYNYFYLIPQFLLKGKIRWYILLLFLGLVAICLMNVAFGYIIHTWFINPEHHHSLTRFLYSAIYPGILAFGLSTSIRITDEWFKNERQKKEMENEKLTSELAFLKSQVNPHFLFNVLNNICSLARKKSDDTENAIIKLSQIMRYMIYDSRDEKVSLGKEVEYLENYIELQRMRISGRVEIRFTVEGPVDQLLIEPLLLIPFVENAFKHGISYREESAILIRLKVEGPSLEFSVENHIARNRNESLQEENGIGLKNVLRRLELLYPGRYDISLRDDGDSYKVFLKITF